SRQWTLSGQEPHPQAVAPAPGQTRLRGPQEDGAPGAVAPRAHSRVAAGPAAAQATKRASYCPPGCGERSKAVTHSPRRLSMASVSDGRWMRPTLNVPVQSDSLTRGALRSVLRSVHST